MNIHRFRDGYIFVLSVLFVGAIAITTTSTLVMLGVAAQRNGFALQQSEQAFLNAQTCIERTLLALRADSTYAGNETITLERGTCEVMAIGGSGNDDRSICAKGVFGTTVRRAETQVATLLPGTSIVSWQEVNIFSFCDE